MMSVSMISTPTTPNADASRMMLAFEIDHGWYSVPVTRVSEILDGATPHISVPRLPPQITGLMKLEPSRELLPLIDVRRTLRLERGAERTVDPRHAALSERIVVFRVAGIRAGIRCDRVSPTLAGGIGRVASGWGAPAGPLPVLNLRRLLRAAFLDPDALEPAPPPPPEPETILTTLVGELRVALDVDRIDAVAGTREEAIGDDSIPRLELASWFNAGWVSQSPTDRKLLRVTSGDKQALVVLGSAVRIKPVKAFHPLPRALGPIGHRAGVTGLAVDQAGNEALVADIDRLVSIAQQQEVRRR